MFNKIASNTIFQVLSKIGTAIISIFLISILTNYFSMEYYGMYSKIYNYLGIFAFLADLGLYTIAIREISSNKSNSAKIIGNIMTLRLILGIAVIFLSLTIAYLLPGYNSSLALSGIFIVGFFTIFGLFNSSILALMQANMKMEFSMFSAISGKLINVSLISIIIFLLYPNNLNPNFDNSFLLVLLAGLLGVIFNTVLNFIYARKIIKINFLFDFKYIKEIFIKSLPYGFALFLSVIYFKVDIILLSILEPLSIADTSIALYSVPMKIIEVLMILGMFFLNSILPSLSNFFKEKNYKQITILLDKSFKVLFSLGLFILTFGLLFNSNIIEIVSNKDYLDSIKYVYTSLDVINITLFILMFNFLSSLFIYILIASDKQSRLLKINIFVTIINIIGNIILIPKYSFYGAAIVTLFSQIVLMLLGYFYSRDIFKIKIDYYFVIKIIVLSIFIYLLGIFLINGYSIGLYLDLFTYGISLISIYLLFTYKLLK